MTSLACVEVELGELGPLGDDHRGVGAGKHVDRRLAHLRARDQLARTVLRDRVVGLDPRALALEPRGKHDARCLAHVIGVGLERKAEQRDLLADERAEVLLELVDDPPLLKLVHLDHGVEELEVVAGVAGELFQS